MNELIVHILMWLIIPASPCSGKVNILSLRNFSTTACTDIEKLIGITMTAAPTANAITVTANIAVDRLLVLMEFF